MVNCVLNTPLNYYTILHSIYIIGSIYLHDKQSVMHLIMQFWEKFHVKPFMQVFCYFSILFMKGLRVLVSGQFPDGHFLDQLFPKGLFLDGQFPEGQGPEKRIPWKDISLTDSSLNHISPNGYFPKSLVLFQDSKSDWYELNKFKVNLIW